jgi:8-amino-7-oxononanoate synthase
MGSTASPGPPQPWADFLRSERNRLERLGLRRSVVTPESRAGVRACLAGREYVLFTSNDYLGLAAHPDVIAAGAEAAGRFGAGAGSARLLHGSTPLHEDLQERLARMTGRQSSLLFSSGYMANLGLLSALAGSGDAIFYDERAHASIIDGARLSGAAALPYPHNDAGRLDDLLRRTHARRRLVATESVFSMDGDLAPLDALGKTASRHHAMLVVDEAHAIGLFGGGSGLLGRFDLDAPAAVTGTLSKALGSIGGFVAGDQALVDFLIDRARTFIFDTALPPSAVAAAAAALDVAREEPWRRKRVLDLGATLRSGLMRLGYPPSCSASQIVPVLLGRPAAALAAEEHLKAHGILARAVRPPAVPRGTSRIRFGVTAAHEEKHLKQVVAAMESFRG